MDQTEAILRAMYVQLNDSEQLIVDYLLGRNGRPKLPAKEIAKRTGYSERVISDLRRYAAEKFEEYYLEQQSPALKETRIVRTITKAAQSKNMVTIVYLDAQGTATRRDTEPYEIKNGAYWGYCVHRQSIRQFKLDRIVDARVSPETYTPRWDVKL